MARLQQHVPHAVVTLFRIMLESDAPAVKARAATVALRFSLQWSELESCEARISELEQDDGPGIARPGTNFGSSLIQMERPA
jgi:hypothetical protein